MDDSKKPDASLAKLLSAIGRSAETDPPPEEPKTATLESESEFLDTELKKLEVRQVEQNIQERKKYARRIYNLIIGWLIAVLSMILASACENIGILIPEPVQIALITGLSVNVLGIFIVVVKYLFPNR